MKLGGLLYCCTAKIGVKFYSSPGSTSYLDLENNENLTEYEYKLKKISKVLEVR